MRFSTSFLDQFQKEDPIPHLNLSIAKREKEINQTYLGEELV